MATKKKATTKKKQEKTGEPGQRIAEALEHLAARAVKEVTGETWEPEPGEPAMRIVRAVELIAYGPGSLLAAASGPTETAEAEAEAEEPGTFHGDRTGA